MNCTFIAATALFFSMNLSYAPDNWEPAIKLVPPPDILLMCGADYSDLSVTGDARVESDAAGTAVIGHKDLDVQVSGCGGGHILRRFTARDNNGHTVSADQRITILPGSTASVQYPASYCSPVPLRPEGFLPENLPKGYGAPIVHRKGCQDLEISYEDRILHQNNFLVSIRRAWTVCDPCSGSPCERVYQTISSPRGDLDRDKADIKGNREGTQLLQNRPNPFTDGTVIGFVLPETTYVNLTVQHCDGRVARVFSGRYPAGYNEVTFGAETAPGQGVLFYTLTTSSYRETKRMVLVQ